jgi:hypothetical protein
VDPAAPEVPPQPDVTPTKSARKAAPVVTEDTVVAIESSVEKLPTRPFTETLPNGTVVTHN